MKKMLCKEKIDKNLQNTHKSLQNKKFTLYSLEYLIFEGKALKLHMPFPILAYLSKFVWPSYAFLQIYLSRFD
jgi:hypothetical protein